MRGGSRGGGGNRGGANRRPVRIHLNLRSDTPIDYKNQELIRNRAAWRAENPN